MISQCHNHPNCSHCFVCEEAINWVEDYGHEFPDGLASCVTCYETKNAAWVWKTQKMWKNFDKLRGTQPIYISDEQIDRLKELEGT